MSPWRRPRNKGGGISNDAKLADGSSIMMEGYMMKSKSYGNAISGRFKKAVSLNWVTRHFTLYSDGRLEYRRDHMPSLPLISGARNKEVCNVSQCTIEMIISEGSRGKVKIPNSFYVHLPISGGKGWKSKSNTRLQLVTNGPEEYAKWMNCFQALHAKIVTEVEDVTVSTSDSSATAIERALPQVCEQDEQLQDEDQHEDIVKEVVEESNSTVDHSRGIPETIPIPEAASKQSESNPEISSVTNQKEESYSIPAPVPTTDCNVIQDKPTTSLFSGGLLSRSFYRAMICCYYFLALSKITSMLSSVVVK